ncbi:MAG TPA: glycogen synthase GlgA [Thermoanaerobaculaceae bacterium]|nr:glycogen synthase GlgA [Thermoanaerobaculaceae bacterium]
MSLRVAHLASEVVPFSKTGGLADVAGSLPPALAALGHEVTVLVPAHRTSLKDAVPGEARGEVKALGLPATLRVVVQDGVRFVLIDCPVLYVRPALYSLPDGDFPDNAVRFAFFARAALAAVAALGGADVVHAHDWQAALAPLLLRHDPRVREALPAARSVVTVHNLAYQGVFEPWVLEPCGLSRTLFTIDTLEFYGQVNFLKGGLVAADAITTVSPTYAREVLTPEFGCRLDGVLSARREALSGILNGLDVREWDPAHDRHLSRPYGAKDVADGKRAARQALAGEAGFESVQRPLLGMVSRLAEQKGADLLAATVDEVVAMGFDLVVLGTGERRYEDAMRAAELAHPGRVKVFTRFDERLAHRIYAASDLFLMPSRYEPCGLGQMIAMRYGALPVVHRTGGLADTVVDAGEASATGFVFDALTPAAFTEVLTRARRALDEPRTLARLRRTAMARDFSWAASAREYAALYQRLLASA